MKLRFQRYLILFVFFTVCMIHLPKVMLSFCGTKLVFAVRTFCSSLRALSLFSDQQRWWNKVLMPMLQFYAYECSFILFLWVKVLSTTFFAGYEWDYAQRRSWNVKIMLFVGGNIFPHSWVLCFQHSCIWLEVAWSSHLVSAPRLLVCWSSFHKLRNLLVSILVVSEIWTIYQHIFLSIRPGGGGIPCCATWGYEMMWRTSREFGCGCPLLTCVVYKLLMFYVKLLVTKWLVVMYVRDFLTSMCASKIFQLLKKMSQELCSAFSRSWIVYIFIVVFMDISSTNLHTDHLGMDRISRCRLLDMWLQPFDIPYNLSMGYLGLYLELDKCWEKLEKKDYLILPNF